MNGSKERLRWMGGKEKVSGVKDEWMDGRTEAHSMDVAVAVAHKYALGQ
jgi:hypothetical protein